MKWRWLRLAFGVLIAVTAAVLVATYAVLSQLDLEDYREDIVRHVEETTGRQLTIAGAMELRFGLWPTVTVEQVSLANADWAEAREMASVRRLEVEAGLLPLIAGELSIRRVVLVQPILRLARHADGRANWELAPRVGEQRPAREGLPRLPGVDALVIENARVIYTDPVREHPFELTIPRADIQRRDDGRMAVEMEAAYQTVAFGVTGTVGGLETLMTPGTRYPVDLAFEAEGAAASVSGTVEAASGYLRPDLQVAVSGDLGVLRPPLAALPAAGTYRVEGRLTAVPAGIRLEGLNARLGNSDLSGRLTLLMDRPRAKLAGELTAARLDIAALRPRDAPPEPDVAMPDDPEPPPPEAAAWQVFPDLALPFWLLHAMDADIDMTVGALRLAQGFTLTGVEGRIAVEQGRLALGPLVAELNHAPVRLALDIDAAPSPAEVALEAESDGLDYGRLLSDTGITGRIHGTADLRADLYGRGESPRALAETLGGTLSIGGEEGRIEHWLFEIAGADVARALAPWRESDDDLHLNCIVGRFHIEDGVVDTRALLADTRVATLGGEGRIDLAEERYDLRLVPHSKQTGLTSLAVPVRLTGPLHTPQLAPDGRGAARTGALVIGSLANPLAALAALIVESATAERNPCVAALERAHEEIGPEGERGGVGGVLEGLGDTIGRTLGVDGNGDTNDPAVLQHREQPRGR